MPNVLPPHASGALAAIEACPAADVIFVAHTGLDRLVSVRDVWRGLRADMEISARWWHVPAAERPARGHPRGPAHLAVRLVAAHRRVDHRGKLGLRPTPGSGPLAQPRRHLPARRARPQADRYRAGQACGHPGDERAPGSRDRRRRDTGSTPASSAAAAPGLGAAGGARSTRPAPGGQPPVRPAEQGHHRRDKQAADHHGVDQDARRRARWRGSSGRSAGPVDMDTKLSIRIAAALVTSRPVRPSPVTTAGARRR